MLLLQCRIPTPNEMDLATFSERQASPVDLETPFHMADGECGRRELGTTLWLGSDSSDVSLFLEYVSYNQCHVIGFVPLCCRNI